MAELPDAAQAATALEALSSRLQELLTDPPARSECLELLKSLHEVGELGVWCRGAGLALARLGEPTITFREMAGLLGVSKSTLSDRYQRWLTTEEVTR